MGDITIKNGQIKLSPPVTIPMDLVIKIVHKCANGKAINKMNKRDMLSHIREAINTAGGNNLSAVYGGHVVSDPNYAYSVYNKLSIKKA